VREEFFVCCFLRTADYFMTLWCMKSRWVGPSLSSTWLLAYRRQIYTPFVQSQFLDRGAYHFRAQLGSKWLPTCSTQDNLLVEDISKIKQASWIKVGDDESPNFDAFFANSAQTKWIQQRSWSSVHMFRLWNNYSCTMAMGSTQPLTEMGTRNFPGGKGRPGRGAGNLTTICEPIV
jgi:hypothetical protein